MLPLIFLQHNFGKPKFKKVGENLELVGIILLVLVIVLIASFITAKIIAVHFYKIIDDFLTSYENSTLDLIRWAKEKDKDKHL